MRQRFQTNPAVDSLPLFMAMMDRLPLGVVLLDREGRVVHFNRYEEKLARRRREQVLGRSFFQEVAPCMNVKELGGRFHDGIGREWLDTEIEFSFPFPFLEVPRDVAVHMTSFEFAGEPYGCLFVEDVSARRAVDRMKENLAQLLVHDFKNPLTVMMANLSAIGEEAKDAANPMLLEAVEDSVAAGHRLQRMIVNLLDVTRLETNAMPIRRTVADLRALVAGVAAEGKALARDYAATLTAELPDTPVEAEVDVDLLRRSLDNLVENAARHSPRNGRIRVSAKAVGGAVELAVGDDGPGVPPELRERIFERYGQQQAQSTSMNRGLGLTFVRLAARAHGGTATVECPEGGGSTFCIRIPRAA